MKTWTLDNRPIVWTITDGTNDRYDLYINGILAYTNLAFEDFYMVYNRALSARKRG